MFLSLRDGEYEKEIKKKIIILTWSSLIRFRKDISSLDLEVTTKWPLIITVQGHIRDVNNINKKSNCLDGIHNRAVYRVCEKSLLETRFKKIVTLHKVIKFSSNWVTTISLLFSPFIISPSLSYLSASNS